MDNHSVVGPLAAENELVSEGHSVTKKRSRVGALLLMALVAPPTLAEDVWASFRGPLGTGEATDVPPGDGPLALELAWKQPLGSGCFQDRANMTPSTCGQLQ